MKTTRKFLTLQIDRKTNDATVSICFNKHKDFANIKKKSDVVIDLTNNLIVKNNLKGF